MFPSTPWEDSEEGANCFLFCDLEMAYFGEFCAKFKVFLYPKAVIILLSKDLSEST